ncbi:MAG: hypothetical protein GC178_09605 [Flavobacteriales bacterium]|nr:hypothetical protein [Flavobacteriales bacterium]
MKVLQWLKKMVLPQVTDFYAEMTAQCEMTHEIIAELYDLHTQHHFTSSKKILKLVDDANKSNRKRMSQLENTFITPFDREAIARAYLHLHWVCLSTKHLVVELDTYEITQLNNYKAILELLDEEMTDLKKAFASLEKKDAAKTMKLLANVIHADDKLIKEYAVQLKQLFKGKDMENILQQREVLSQLKEISKRIHICANHVEDILFKMN